MTDESAQRRVRPPVTSHDVARLAGVSQPTVSRALRAENGVSDATRQRVLDAADKLGYVPIQTGRSLATKRTGRVGIVAGELSNPYFAALVGPLHRELGRVGYGTILLTDDGMLDTGALSDGSLDGVLLATSRLNSPIVGELMRRGVPLVQVGREVDGVESDSCVFDNRDGAGQVADLMVEAGHRRIAALFGPSDTSTGRDREHGFRDSLAERGIGLPSAYALHGLFTFASGYEGLQRLVAADPAPTAVFCANDVIAIGALNAAADLGVRVPEQVSIVGFDDIDMASWRVFRLSTVRLDFERMAATSCRLLVERMTEPSQAYRREVLPVSLRARSTHASLTRQ